MKIRLLIVDNHALVRQGLAFTFANAADFEVIGQASNGAEAIRLCAQITPDLILMDVVMHEMDGIEATRRIKQQFPAVKIIALSSYGHHQLVQEMLRAGATQYVAKDVDPQELVQRVRAVASDIVLPRRRAVSPGGQWGLTQRELDILILIAEGLGRQEIAERLNISYDTVKTHVRNIFTKLGVNSSAEAVRFALENRLL